MTSRVSENQMRSSLYRNLVRNRTTVNNLSEEISSGLKVQTPGDSRSSATISEFKTTLQKVEEYQQRTKLAQDILNLQENTLGQAQEVMTRAKELATQGANQTLSAEDRRLLSAEVFELRDQIVAFANTTYQGRYIFSGASDDTPAYSLEIPYTNPGNGSPSDDRYQYDTSTGSNLQRNVNVTDSLTVQVNLQGNQVFDNAIWALERLGRSLEGYQTLPLPTGEPAVNAEPDGTGDLYTAGANPYDTQTDELAQTIDLIDEALKNDFLPNQVAIAGRLRRLESANSVLTLTETHTKEVLANLQEADIIESASNLTEAQTALEASLAVTTQLLRQSILDFI